MKKIERSEEITFSAISIQDAVLMVPLMDRLAEEFRALATTVGHDPHNFELQTKYVQLGNQLHTLEELGFCTSFPGMIQYDPQYFPV